MGDINQAWPRAVFKGFKDESGTTLPVELEQIPQHLPYLFLQTERGPVTPQLVTGDKMLEMYGENSFDELYDYFSHQTLLANVINTEGNALFIKRMVDENAGKATLTLKLEIIKDTLEAYVRSDLTGYVTENDDGSLVTDPDTTFTGYRLKWIVEELTEDAGTQTPVTPGTMTSSIADEESTIYPIMDFEASHVGSYGDLLGIRFSAPHSGTSEPASSYVVDDEDVFLYRIQFVERPDAKTSPEIVESIYSETYLDFSFKFGVINDNTDQTYETDRILDNYNDFTKGQVPEYGPMGTCEVYTDYIDSILELLYDAEVENGTYEPAAKECVNFFTGVSYDGYYHDAVRIDSDSAVLDDDTTHYLSGGTDGVISEDTLDDLVAVELEYNWEDSDYPLVDRQKYPFSCMYDSGFSLATKKQMLYALGNRPDFYVTVGTFVAGADALSIAEESSSGNALKTAAQLVPESSVYGTEVCRAVIVRHEGEAVASRFGRRASMVLDLAQKRAKYMGASNGIMKSSKSYNTSPNNYVSALENVTNPWVSDTMKESFWDDGVNGVQSVSRSDLFWPAFQTVYSDDTSILNSEILMTIMVDVTKMADYTWTQLTGDDKLTDAQFFEKSDEIFANLVKGRYDNRVVIVGTTYKTTNDSLRGFTWSMDIAVYGNVMRTVGQYNVIARRMSDLEA